VLPDHISAHLDPLKAQASYWIHQAMEQVASIDNYLIDDLSNSVGVPITAWLTQHPLLAWLVNHPLMALLIGLVAAILLVRLLLTIYRAIATSIDRIWLAILRSPLFLLKFLFGWETKPKTATSSTTVTNYEVTNDPQQLQQIINRLDQIQQQQQEIIQELALLKQQAVAIEPQQLRLKANLPIEQS
jgi:hypothetical protein